MQPAWQWMMNKAQLRPTLAPGRSRCSVSRHRLTVWALDHLPPRSGGAAGDPLSAQLLLLPHPQQAGSPWCLFGNGDNASNAHTTPELQEELGRWVSDILHLCKKRKALAHRRKRGLHVQTFPRN